MKKLVSGVMLMLLMLGTLTLTLNAQPARAAGIPTSISVSVSPHYAVMSGGQSQVFNSTVTGGSPPYAYQWTISGNPVSGETNPTYDFTAPLSAGASYYVELWVTDSANESAAQYVWVWEPAWNASVYYSVEPAPVTPLTNVNASINGLETPPTPSAVGQDFTVEIHLRNATATNVPYGVSGLKVHFYFGNILNYCQPTGFANLLGQPGGVLLGPAILYCVGGDPGFYDNTDNLISLPPYTNATQYIVEAADTDTPWNGNDGLVAKIVFQITGEPGQDLSQPDYYAPLQIGFGLLYDGEGNGIAFSVVQGTLRIDSAGVGDLNGDGKVGLDDLVLLANAYGSKPGDPNWNPLADIAPPYGIISLTDLVTLAMHYG